MILSEATIGKMSSTNGRYTCPKCGTHLSTLDHPCPNCQLGFIDYSAPCPKCSQPLIATQGGLLKAAHTLECPGSIVRWSPPDAAPVLCPLCGGKRHWKMAEASREQCLWRQWAKETGKMANPDDWQEQPPERTPALDREYQKWRAANPTREGGSVPAERILRQRARTAK